MGAIFTNIAEIFAKSGWAQIFFTEGGWKYAVMLAVACVLLYLAIVKQFEPLLLLPIGFGMLMTNLPLDGIFHMDIFINSTNHIDWALLGSSGGMVDYIYLGVKLGIYPPLIFLGIGTMTDFEPLIARPSSLLLGAAAQLGIFFTFVGAKILGFTNQEAGAIGIIGGADGPTAIYVTTKLAPHLLGSIAVAAYCYMALVPVIQPPIMKALTTEKERQIVMTAPRRVSKTEKILFPIIVTIIVALTLPDAAILVGCLMMGNLMKESGVVERITKTAGNELMNIITIFLGFSVGCTTRPLRSSFWASSPSVSAPPAVFSWARSCALSPTARSTRSSAPPVFPPFPWPPVFPRRSAKSTTPATTCSCTPWAPTLPVLSAPPLPLVS